MNNLAAKNKPWKLKFPRLFLWAFVLPTVILTSCSSLQGKAYPYSITPTNDMQQFMQIKVLGSMAIKPMKLNSLPIAELSDIAWDKDEHILYAVSDEGYLYHLEIEIKGDKLLGLKIVSAAHLLNRKNKKLRGKFSDAEGLTLKRANNKIKGDSQLIISFENKPRISRFSTLGKELRKIKIPKILRKKKNYRNKNKALESVTLHPKYGILTASELPLKREIINQQSIYSEKGLQWKFPSLKVKNSSITALESMPNGEILILERAYNGFLSPIVISLRQLNLEKCNNSNLCKTEEIATFDSSDGWILDNFEGLTHFRDNQYLMVSDNNNNPLQKTILVLFEILDK